MDIVNCRRDVIYIRGIEFVGRYNIETGKDKKWFLIIRFRYKKNVNCLTNCNYYSSKNSFQNCGWVSNIVFD